MGAEVLPVGHFLSIPDGNSEAASTCKTHSARPISRHHSAHVKGQGDPATATRPETCHRTVNKQRRYSAHGEMTLPAQHCSLVHVNRYCHVDSQEAAANWSETASSTRLWLSSAHMPMKHEIHCCGLRILSHSPRQLPGRKYERTTHFKAASDGLRFTPSAKAQPSYPCTTTSSKAAKAAERNSVVARASPPQETLLALFPPPEVVKCTLGITAISPNVRTLNALRTGHSTQHTVHHRCPVLRQHVHNVLPAVSYGRTSA